MKRILPLVLCLLIALTACTPAAPKAIRVEGAERDAVLAYSEAMADNYFASLNAGDYTAFTKDFDPTLKKATTQASFDGLKKTLSKVGAYQSRTVDHVEKVQTYYSVFYKAQFEQDIVTVRLTFNQDAPHQIAGTWFTSPKLAAP